MYFASAAPAIRHPNVYGIDMPSRTELIAHEKTEEEVSTAIGADWVCYQDLEDLQAAVRQENEALTEFDTSCFSGSYVTGDVTEEYFTRLQKERSDTAMALKNLPASFCRTFSNPDTGGGGDDEESIDMYNDVSPR